MTTRTVPPGRRAPAVWAWALVLGACGPGAAPAPGPRAPAEPVGSPFTLPALGGDGFPVPEHPLDAPLLPSVTEGTATDSVLDRADVAWSPPETDASEPGPRARLDGTALIDGLDLSHEEKDGVLTFSGPDAALAGRVLAAAAAAVRRGERVEAAALRLAPGARPPSADEALAARGPEVILRVDRVLRDGAALVADERETVTWPASAEVHDNGAYAARMGFDVGPRLAVSPARVEGGRSVLRVAFHEARVVGERFLAGDDVERAAPSLAVAALVFEAPAADGRAAMAVADSGDAATSFVLAWRVTPTPDVPPPPGTRILPVHASRPVFAAAPFVSCGPLDLLRESSDPPALDLPAPPRLAGDLAARVRVVVAAPGVAIAVGDESALARLDANRPAAPGAARLLAGGASIPFVRTAPLALLQGRLDPAALALDSEIAQESAMAAYATSWIFSGRSLRAGPRGGDVEWRESSASAPTIATGHVEFSRELAAESAGTTDVIESVRRTCRERNGLLLPRDAADVGADGGAATDTPALEAHPW